MIYDALGLFSNAQALTATAFCTDKIDLTATTPQRDLGDGEPLTICIGVDVAADFTTGNETYQFDFVQSANADLSSPTVLQSRIIVATLLTLGSLHYLDVPAGSITARYIGVQYTLGGTTPTITVTAYLTLQNFIQRFRAYAKNFVVN